MNDLAKSFAAFDRVELLLAEVGPDAVRSHTLEDALDFLPCVAEFAALRWAWWDRRGEDLITRLPPYSRIDMLRTVLPRFKKSGHYGGISLLSAGLLTPNGEISTVPHINGDWSAGSDFQMFQQRLRDGLAKRGVKFASELVGAFDEMAGNAAEHAMAPVLPSACYQFTDSCCVIGITDVGRGVLESIRENPAYASVSGDSDGLRLVLQEGVSRTGKSGRGNGFSYVFKKLADRSCVLRFRAVASAALLEGQGSTPNRLTFSFLPPRVGFHVCIAVPYPLGGPPNGFLP